MQQMKEHFRSGRRTVAIDVGAYKGEFFRPYLRANLLDHLILFEPHAENAAALYKCLNDPRISVEVCAVADKSGRADFYFGEDAAIGSLLLPDGPIPAASQKKNVPIVSIDEYADRHGLTGTVNYLKVDVQGADLLVLKGAETMLSQSRPILIVELIFTQLYQGQADAVTIISWLAERDYRLVAFFDEHFSRQGWLAWTDACFVPVSRLTEYQLPFSMRVYQS